MVLSGKHVEALKQGALGSDSVRFGKSKRQKTAGNELKVSIKELVENSWEDKVHKDEKMWQPLPSSYIEHDENRISFLSIFGDANQWFKTGK